MVAPWSPVNYLTNFVNNVLVSSEAFSIAPLYMSSQIVVAEGGYDEVTAQKKWSEIGRKVGIPRGNGMCAPKKFNA